MGLSQLFLVLQENDGERISEANTEEFVKRFLHAYHHTESNGDENRSLIIVQHSENFKENSLNVDKENAANIKLAKDLTCAFSVLFKSKQISNIRRRTLAEIGDQLVAIQLCSKSDEASGLNPELSSANNLIWKTYKNLMTFKALKSSDGSIDSDHGYPILSKEESSIFEKYHTFCTKSNFQDIVDYCNEACRGLQDSFVDVAILDHKRSNFEKVLLTCLIGNAQKINCIKYDESSCEFSEAAKEEALSHIDACKRRLTVPQSPRICQNNQELSQRMMLTPIASQSSGVFYPETPTSCAKNQLKTILLSYLRLLVNTRDEIALARVINAPNRDLHHGAFTDLRKTAEEKGLPMFQTAVSFVLQVRLGGKGYAPNENCVLRKHIKGLSDFVSLMNKLQNILEESSEASDAVKLVLSSLRRAFVKAKVPIFSSETVLSCIEELERQLLERVKGVASAKELPKSTIVELKVVLALNEILEEHAMTSFLEFENGERIANSILSTPEVNAALVKLPSLYSQFRTPDETSAETPRRVRGREERPNDKSKNKRSIIGDMRWAQRCSNFDNTETSSCKRPRIDMAFAKSVDITEEQVSNDENVHLVDETKETDKRTEMNASDNKRDSKSEDKKLPLTERNNNPERLGNNKRKSVNMAERKRTKPKEKIKREEKTNAKAKNRKVKLLAGQKQLTSFFQKRAVRFIGSR